MDLGYNFTISESFTPKTIPMDRLAAYIAGLARLLGECANVHLDTVNEGSVAIRVRVEDHARPKVRDRVNAIRTGSAPKEALKAYHDLDEMLRKDNAVGVLAGDAEDVVVPFPGRRRPEPTVFGPFRQAGHIDGQVYRIEGKDDTKHVGVRDGDRDYGSLVTNEAVALRLRHQMWERTLRFHGIGSWMRHGSGSWELRSFRVHDFEVLDDAPLEDMVKRLRAVTGSELSTVPDAVQRLLADRPREIIEVIVAFDASVLLYLLDETVAAPPGDDGQPAPNCQDRVSHLIAELQRVKAKIVIPAPSLAEVLVYAGDAAAAWLNILNTSRHISIAPFDERAAVEYAVMERSRIAAPRIGTPRPKAKFDEQIVAIARVEGATTIYSDDRDIRRLWENDDQVVGIAQLPLPPKEAQMKMEFDPHINEDDGPTAD